MFQSVSKSKHLEVKELITNGSRILRIIVMTSKSLEKENIPGTKGLDIEDVAAK